MKLPDLKKNLILAVLRILRGLFSTVSTGFLTDPAYIEISNYRDKGEQQHKQQVTHFTLRGE